MFPFAVLLLFLTSDVDFTHGRWTSIPGSMKHATASVNFYWAVNSSDQLFLCPRPCNGGWVHSPGNQAQLDASDSEVWGINSVYGIWTRPVDGTLVWRPVTGQLKHISASGNGFLWGVTIADQVFNCKKPCNGAWQRIDGSLSQVDGGWGYVYGVNSSGAIYRRAVEGSGSWRLIPGKLRQITASGLNYVFGVDFDNRVWQCKNPCEGEWEQISANNSAKQCDATINALICVSPENAILEYRPDRDCNDLM